MWCPIVPACSAVIPRENYSCLVLVFCFSFSFTACLLISFWPMLSPLPIRSCIHPRAQQSRNTLDPEPPGDWACASQQPLQGGDAAGPVWWGVVWLESSTEKSCFLCIWLTGWVKEPSSYIPWLVIALPVTSVTWMFHLRGVGKGECTRLVIQFSVAEEVIVLIYLSHSWYKVTWFWYMQAVNEGGCLTRSPAGAAWPGRKDNDVLPSFCLITKR